MPEEQGILCHIKDSWEEIRLALEPEADRENFRLDKHGSIGILEREDEVLEAFHYERCDELRGDDREHGDADDDGDEVLFL